MGSLWLDGSSLNNHPPEATMSIIVLELPDVKSEPVVKQKNVFRVYTSFASENTR